MAYSGGGTYAAQPYGAQRAGTGGGGRATETDAARAGTVTKGPVIKVGGKVVETNTARAGTATVRRVLLGGKIAETDTARAGAAVIGRRTLLGGRAPEVDVARAGSHHSGAVTIITGGSIVEVHAIRQGAASTSAVAVRAHRWTLIDPSRGESYEFPLNPNKMTTPHSPRNFNIIATAPSGILTGGSRQGMGRVVELAREPFEWTFSGRIKTEEHYQELLRWSNKVNRLQLTDHLGRTWSIRPLAFNPNELIPTQRIPWRYEYDFKVLNYGVVA